MIGDYLAACRRRLAVLARLRITGLGLAAVVALTIGFALAMAYLVPAGGWIVAARVVLYGALLALVIGCIRRRIHVRQAVRRAERRVPAFDGRLATWFDAGRREPRPALLAPLAKEAGAIAARHAPRSVVPTWLMALPVAFAVVAVAALAWFLLAAPAGWRLPAERLWLGDAFADTRPRIVVSPGDTVVPRGADVLLRARPHGFAADALRVSAAFGDGPWQEADMLAPTTAGEEHEFVLVAVTDPVDYFVASGGLSSARFRIEVADLPKIAGLDVLLDYPAWTHLAQRRQTFGDVSGVVGTQVTVAVQGSDLDAARLVVDGEPVEFAGGRGGFAIERPGGWHVAVPHEGELVRISDQYLIDVREDEPPEVEFAFPGRDRSASPIEEVALRFRARDDFAVEALRLHVAVNDGEWTVLESESETGAPEAESSHLLYLEDLRAGERAMRPGDVLSFFAEAVDHGQSTRSALYFVDVRAFDKRYREQVGAGSGSGSGGDGGSELSDRQREIVSATWNLIRERDTGERAGDDLIDQIDTVGLLQGTLLDQAETLVARSAGRRLVDDAEVGPFVAGLRDAAAAMTEAVLRLDERDLDGAVGPERLALQHLLTAEASLRDVDVTLTQQSEGGGGSSRSLSELMDLEMDPERNRYEVPQSPRFDDGAADSAEDEWQRLTELARRHEELARREREQRPVPQSRWQLERLQRELESLRDQLERSERGGAQSPQASAARAAEAVAQALSGEGDREEAFRRGAEALREGAEAVRRGEQQAAADEMRRAARRAEALLAEERRIAELLEDLQQETLEASRDRQSFRFRDYAMADEADAKRRMQETLGDITGDLTELRTRLERDGQGQEGALREIDRALDELADSRLAERLSAVADYFEYGRPLFAIGQASQVEAALEQFARRLGRAAERLEGTVGGALAGPSVDDVQRLRRRMEESGFADAGALRPLLDETRDLAWDVLEGGAAPDLSAMRESYRGLGANESNRERLYRLALAELDRMEVALAKAGREASVRAARPREEGYDERPVADYFRRLSCEDC